MNRHVFIFLGTFALGATLALIARAVLHDPYAAPAGQVAATPSNPAADAPPPAAIEHGADPAHAAAAHDAAAAGGPVNTVCAICGMDVDPAIPTAQYQGRTIGFGCAMCPPKFRAEPDRYGPAALENRVVED